MNSHVLAAIRSQPWAIMPEYLAAIEAIALRALDHPAIVAVEADGHKERMVEAAAEMGGRFPGSRNATIREGDGCQRLLERKRDVKGKSVSVRVDPGGRRTMKKKKSTK